MTSQQLRQDWGKPRFIVFLTGAAITVAVGLWLYIAVFIHESGVPNLLALFTVLGAPLAYWLAWITPSRKLVRVISVILYLAAMSQTIFGVVVFFYMPGLIGILAGTPTLRPQPKNY